MPRIGITWSFMRAAVLPLAAAVWMTGAGTGFVALAAYKATPGPALRSPGDWPAGTALQPGARFTLVLFAHPRCPCTRASLSQLREVLSSHGEGVRAYVVLVRPRGAPAGFERSALWASAASIPGVTVVADPDGAEAERFRADTSGHAALYDAAGRLRFSGGLTSSRGHQGDSPGQDAVRAILSGRALPGGAGGDGAPVFGCPVQDAPAPPVEEG